MGRLLFKNRGKTESRNELKPQLKVLLQRIKAAPDSRILDQEFIAKERIMLRELERMKLLRVLNYHNIEIYWKLTRRGIESISGRVN